MAGDPHWDKVVLAMHMDGANGSTVFTDLKGNAVTAVGNAQISTVQSKFGGASAYFDGAGDYLSVPRLIAGTAFTAECWFRVNAIGVEQVVFSQYSVAAGAGRCGATVNASGFPTFFVNGLTGGNLTLTHASAVTAQSWNHIAVVRDGGGNFKLYVNGVGGVSELRTGDLENDPFNIGRLGNNSLYFTGYIDDLRITKGVARYTANFTPPTQAFPNGPAMISGTTKDATGAFAPRAVRVHRKSDGALSGAVTSHATTGAFSVPALDGTPHYAIAHDTDADPYWDKVVLATRFDTDSVIDPHMNSVVLGLHMDGANGSTVFQDVTGKTVTAVGNAQISTVQSKFGGASALFDGAGDVLRLPTGADWQFGTGNFTIELWVYPTTVGVVQGLLGQRLASDGANNWLLRINTNNTVLLSVATASATVTSITSISTVAAANWTHIAISRVDGVVTLRINGVANNTITTNLTTAWPSVSTTLQVGGYYGDNTIETFYGYIDDLRITKGVARYTANFTPPTAPFSSFKDLTGKDLMVNGVPSISTVTKKYGDGALSLNGTGQYLTCVGPNLGAGDFTVEVWGYWADLVNRGILHFATGPMPGAATGFMLAYNGTNLYAFANGAQFTFAYSPVINTWAHIAVTRLNGQDTVYINGAAIGTFVDGGNYTTFTTLHIGGYYSTGYLFNGRIDDLRITKGVARYVTGFTPPERAFAGAMGAGTRNALIFDDLTPL